MNGNEPSDNSLRDRFRQEGVCGPVPILDSGFSSEMLEKLTAFRDQARNGDGDIDWASLEVRPWEDSPVSSVETLLLSLAMAPEVISSMVSVMGPDVFLRNIDVFWKDPVPWAWAKKVPWAPREEIDWHCDEPTSPESRKKGTLWLALTDSAPGSGGIVYRPGSHQVPLRSPVVDAQGLSFDRERLEDIRETPEWNPCLKPGEGLLHEGNVVHRSASNRSLYPRVGIAFRFAHGELSTIAAGASTGIVLNGTIRDEIQRRKRVPIQWWHTERVASVDGEETRAFNPDWFELELHGFRKGNATEVQIEWGILCGGTSRLIAGWSAVSEVNFAFFEQRNGEDSSFTGAVPVHAGAIESTRLKAEGVWRRTKGWWRDSATFQTCRGATYCLRVVVFLEDGRLGWRDLLIPSSDIE